MGEKDDDDRNLTRATLLLRLRDEDPQPRALAWREFHDLYGPMIGGFVRKIGGRAQEVEDVVQDVMTGFFAAAPKFVYDPAKGRFRGYLKKCTIAALAKRRAQDARFRAMPADEPAAAPTGPSLDELWEQVWEQQLLRQALAAVRERYGDNKTYHAFERYVIGAQEPADVAASLHMSVNSVYKAKERITRSIREEVDRLRAERG